MGVRCHAHDPPRLATEAGDADAKVVPRREEIEGRSPPQRLGGKPSDPSAYRHLTCLGQRVGPRLSRLRINIPDGVEINTGYAS